MQTPPHMQTSLDPHSLMQTCDEVQVLQALKPPHEAPVAL